MTKVEMDCEKSDNKKFKRGREYKIDQEKPSGMYEYSSNTINCNFFFFFFFKKKTGKGDNSKTTHRCLHKCCIWMGPNDSARGQ